VFTGTVYVQAMTVPADDVPALPASPRISQRVYATSRRPAASVLHDTDMEAAGRRGAWMNDEEAERAFTEYFSSRQTWLRGVAYLLCQDSHRADDLLQTTAIKLYTYWHRTAQIQNLDSYVRRILIHVYLAELRSPWWKRVLPHWELDGAVDAPDPAEALDLRAALRALPPRQRATVVLRYYDELSVQETADVLRCSTGTVKSQTARALAALRRTLSDSDDDAADVPSTFTVANTAHTAAARAEGSKA